MWGSISVFQPSDRMCIVTDTAYILSPKSRVQLAQQLNVEDLLEKAVNQLYDDRKIDDATRRRLAASHYEPLRQAVNEGYGQVQKRFEYGTPNYEFLKQLQTNTAVFAVFKNHACMKDMAALLKDASGNLRSREDFKREALKVDATYRGSKLDTEYDTAVRQTRMAANWQKYEAKKKLYPNLRYVMSKAAKPDEKHLSYVGIVRPVDDPFWNVHLPPNRWRCQCSVEQTDDEPTDIPAKLPPVDPAFAFNSGKTGQVFDIPNSEYIKSVAPKEQPKLIKEAQKLVETDKTATAPFQPMYESKSGTKVEAHPWAFKNSDFDADLKAARDLANSHLPVKNIQLLPRVQNEALRQQLVPDAKGKKDPDFRVDGKVMDAKELTGKKPGKGTVQNALSSANGQGYGAVLHVPQDYQLSKYKLYKLINQKLSYEAYKDFELYLNYKGDWEHYTWKSWQQHYAKVIK